MLLFLPDMCYIMVNNQHFIYIFTSYFRGNENGIYTK